MSTTKTEYPAYGWLPPGAKFVWQRSDQGRDFVTDWNGVIQAPGDFECVTIGQDRPFPNGFGPDYPWVKITSGAFENHIFYIGHCSTLVRVGDRGSFGHALARSNQGKPSQIGINVPGDGGWVELGEVTNGRPGPYSDSGHWYDHFLEKHLVVTHKDPALKFGDKGLRVMGLTSLLRDCGWLPRPYWNFNTQVHGAVVAFKMYHHIPMPPIAAKGKPQADRGVVDAHTDVVLAHAAAWCKKNHKKEHNG